MAIVYPVQRPRTTDPKEIDRFFRDLVDRLSYLTYAGSPVSNVTPRFIYDQCLDTTNHDWFMATGTTSADWEQITYAAGTMGDHGTLDGLEDDDHIDYLKEKAAGGLAAEVPTHTHADAANAGTIDHGALTGASDDDHTQYLKEKASGGAASEIPTHTHADADNAGTVDHGALTGLTDDDHTQYIKHSLVTAANDFLVASGSGVIVKKTLAETKTIIGLPNVIDRGDPAAWDFDLTDLTTDGAWHDLDLSSVAPAGALAVILFTQVKDDATNSYLMFRKNGNSNEYNVSATRTLLADVYIGHQHTVFLDSSRVIEYKATSTTFTEIYIIVCGWII